MILVKKIKTKFGVIICFDMYNSCIDNQVNNLILAIF